MSWIEFMCDSDVAHLLKMTDLSDTKNVLTSPSPAIVCPLNVEHKMGSFHSSLVYSSLEQIPVSEPSTKLLIKRMRPDRPIWSRL